MKRKLFRFAAAAAALAVAMLGLVIPAGAGPLASTIDTEKEVTLHIHKHVGPTVIGDACKADGTELASSCTTANPGIKGAKFKVYRVKDVNLTTNAGWVKAKTYYNNGEIANPDNDNRLTLVGEYTTNAHGYVKVPDADLEASWSTGVSATKTGVGFYYVVEQVDPNTKEFEGTTYTDPDTETGGVTSKYTGAVPFFVTLPMTNPKAVQADDTQNPPVEAADPLTTWMYDVHAYPKNDPVTKPHKAVIDEGQMTPTGLDVDGNPEWDVDNNLLNPGSEIKYRVSGVIPNYGDVVGAPLHWDNINHPDYTGELTSPGDGYNRWDMQYLYIQDTFPVELIVPKKDSEIVTNVWVVKSDVDTTKLTDFTTGPGGELVGTLVQTLDDTNPYTITRTENKDPVTDKVTGTTVKVDFTGPGLDQLATWVTANPGAQVVVEFKTHLKSVPEDGLIENSAFIVPGPKPQVGSDPAEPPNTPPPGDETPEVITKYGLIEIYKVGVTGKGTPTPTPGKDDETALKDVEFEIYLAKKTKTGTGTDGWPTWDYSCKRDDIAFDPADPTKPAVPVDSFKTNAKGYGSSKPLQLSNWYNDGVEKHDKGTNNGHLSGAEYAKLYGENQYCLVEVKAAENYQLLAQPFGPISLNTAGATTKFDENSDAWKANVQKIVNQRKNIGNELPLTGAQGVVALSVVGLLLIGGGTAYYVAYSRKRKA